MGIDAELLIRVKGDKPSDKQITQWSWDLCRAIGAAKFFIKDGLPQPQYSEAQKAWHAAFNAHPRYASFNAKREGDNDTWRAERAAIIADIGESPEQRRRALELTNYIYPLDDEDYYADIPAEYREPGRCWTQDGDTVFAASGEWFLRASLWTRYYGPGYERGDILTICAVAEWCEANIPDCVVWYGGDSSGIEAEPFPEAKRAEFRRHLYSPKGRAYFEYDKRHRSPGPRPAPCSLCAVNGGDFNQFGSSGDGHYIAVSCGGCGKNFRSDDHGKTWAEEKEAA